VRGYACHPGLQHSVDLDVQLTSFDKLNIDRGTCRFARSSSTRVEQSSFARGFVDIDTVDDRVANTLALACSSCR
jgi:hypothetical protein